MKTAGLAFATLLVSVSSAAAQADRVEVSLSAAAAFSKTSTATNSAVTLKPTKSGEVFGTVQYHFSKMHSFEVNIGHLRNSQIYTVPPDSYRVIASITEFSGAYVFSPFAAKKFAPFLLGGVGALRFNPGNTYIDGFQVNLAATMQTSLAFVYGAGTDYHLWRVLWLRAQYRGLIYRVPDFNRKIFFTGAHGHLAEPSLGLAIRF